MEDEKEKPLFGVHFEVFGLFEGTQGFVNKVFIEKTGTFMTMTGWLEDTDRGSVRGYCEGERVYIDGMKFLIHEDEINVPFIDKTVFEELIPIEERQFKNFTFRNNIVTPEIVKFFTPRKPEEKLVDSRRLRMRRLGQSFDI